MSRRPTLTAGAYVGAVRDQMIARIGEALDAGASLDLLAAVYAQAGNADYAPFTDLVRRAETIRAWRSDRPAAVARLAGLGVAIPESLMDDEHRARAAVLSYHTDRRVRDNQIDVKGETWRERLPLVPEPAELAKRDPLPAGALTLADLEALGVAAPAPEALTLEALAELAEAVEQAQKVAA